MGIKEKIEQRNLELARQRQEAAEREAEERETKFLNLKVRNDRIQWQTRERQDELVRYAESTPLPTMLAEAAQALHGEVVVYGTNTYTNHSEQQYWRQWTADDEVSLKLGDTLKYQIRWRFSGDSDCGTFDYINATISFDGDIGIESQAEPRGAFKEFFMGTSKEVKLSQRQWGSHPEVIENVLLEAIEHPLGGGYGTSSPQSQY